MSFLSYGIRPKAIRLFEVAVCSWVTLHSIKMLGIRHLILPSAGLCHEAKSTFPLQLDAFIFHFGTENLFVWAIGFQIVICLAIIVRGSNFLLRLGLWFLTINILATCPSVEDGGTTLIKTLLLFYVFIQTKYLEKENPVRMLFQSALVLSMQLQIALVYLQAGISKITTDGWSTGVALHYILQVPEFSDRLISPIILRSELLIVMGTFATIIFQLSFPFWIWNRSMRRILLTIGIGFHLIIALSMNLFSFGLLMIAFYPIFLDDTDVTQIKSFFGKFPQAVRRATSTA